MTAVAGGATLGGAALIGGAPVSAIGVAAFGIIGFCLGGIAFANKDLSTPDRVIQTLIDGGALVTKAKIVAAVVKTVDIKRFGKAFETAVETAANQIANIFRQMAADLSSHGGQRP